MSEAHSRAHAEVLRSESRLTQKFQATIPRIIRKKLGLKQGDRVSFEVEDGEVVLRKAPKEEDSEGYLMLLSMQSTLSDWNSEADNIAFADL